MAQTSLPKVPIYSAPDKPLNVSGTGVEQIARAGARVGEEGQEVERLQAQSGQNLDRGAAALAKGIDTEGAVLQQHDNIADLNNLNAAHASTLLGLTQQQQKFFSDPANANNPSAVSDFQERYVQPAVDALNDMAQTKAGQEHAANLTGALEDHFVQTSANTSAANAALATKNSMAYVGNALTSATQQNPDNIKAALNAYDTMMTAYGQQHPEINLDKDSPERLAARREIVATGLISLIDKSVQDTGQPPDLSGYFSAYGKELGGQEQQIIQNHADAKVKAYQEQQKADVATQRTVETDAAKQAATKIMSSMVQLGPSGEPTGQLAVPKDFYSNILKLGNMDGATEAQVKSSIELARSLQKEPPGYQGAHDDTTFGDFMKRAFAPEGQNPLTYQDVNTARAQGKLTNQEYTQFNAAVKNAQAQTASFDKQLIASGLNTVRMTLSPLGPASLDPGGDAAKVQNFEAWYYPQLHALTTGPNAISTADAVTRLVTPQNIQLHGVAVPAGQAATAELPPANSNPEGGAAAAVGGAVKKAFTGLFGGQ